MSYTLATTIVFVATAIVYGAQVVGGDEAAILELNGKYCVIKELLQNGNITKASDQKFTLQINDVVPLHSTILFRCNRFYGLISDNESAIECNGQEIVPPKCHKLCSQKRLTSEQHTHTAVCTLNNQIIECVNEMTGHLPGTEVQMSCAYGYKPINADTGKVITCKSNGEWTEILRCEQECGRQMIDPIGGEEVLNGKLTLPWHVDIWTENVYMKTFLQICGGTIVKSNYIVSAASCFWDTNKNAKLVQYNNLKITVGHQYRDYKMSQTNGLAVQKVDIKSIIVPNNFKYWDNNFRSDIAVVELNDHIHFSPNVAPICLNNIFNSQSDVIIVDGVMANWIKNDAIAMSNGSLSRSVHPLNSTDVENCKTKLEKVFADSMTSDKYCANNEGRAFSVEDLGNGHAVLKNVSVATAHDTSKSAFFLHGINSMSSYHGSDYLIVLKAQLYESFIFTAINGGSGF